jgi:hypothetical protein
MLFAACATGTFAAGTFNGVRTGKTMYEMIGAVPTATQDELFRAFQAASEQFRPNDPSGNLEAYRTVEGIWEILRRPGLRALYDDYLAEQAKAAPPVKTDGMYHLELFQAYVRVLLKDMGDADPPGYAHRQAFSVFRSVREMQTRPEPRSRDLAWGETTAGGTCKLWLGRIGRSHAVIGVIGTALVGTAIGWHLATPTPPPLGAPGTDPGTPPSAPLAPPPNPDPATAAAELRGQNAADQLRDDPSPAPLP